MTLSNASRGTCNPADRPLVNANIGQAIPRVVLVLPGWLFARGKSLLPAIAALMPVGITTALNALDLGPGIAGFDRTGPDAQWQPIWFNALGAGLLAVGMQPLLKAWSPR